jgi:hypothetical protein
LNQWDEGLRVLLNAGTKLGGAILDSQVMDPPTGVADELIVGTVFSKLRDMVLGMTADLV